MIVVVTADQRASRRGADLVPQALEVLNSPRRRSPHRSFERTAGDEVQGVLGDAADAIDVAHALLRDGHWSVGLGVGEVELPLPRSSRAGRGAAYVAARSAVERAKHAPARVCVVADDEAAGQALETVLMLWSDLLDRRTRGGWEVADLLAEGLAREEVARRLGVTVSAVGQRVAAAGLALSERARSLAVDMLEDLLATGPR